jgi:hypothetical protein
MNLISVRGFLLLCLFITVVALIAPPYRISVPGIVSVALSIFFVAVEAFLSIFGWSLSFDKPLLVLFASILHVVGFVFHFLQLLITFFSTSTLWVVCVFFWFEVVFFNFYECFSIIPCLIEIFHMIWHGIYFNRFQLGYYCDGPVFKSRVESIHT